MGNASRQSVILIGVVFSILILGSCTNETEPLQIEPSLLPSPLPMVMSGTNDTYVNTVPKSESQSDNSEVAVDLSHGLQVSSIPLMMEENWGIYPMHRGEGYIFVDIQEDVLPDTVIKDINEYLGNLRPAYRNPENSKDASSMAIRLAWLEEAYSRLYDNTGWRPVIVHELLTPATSDAEESVGYAYWVKEPNEAIHSTIYPDIDEATEEAQEWITNEGTNTEKYAIVVSSTEGS